MQVSIRQAGRELSRLINEAVYGVQLVPPTLELDRLALWWTDRLGQAVAYDAHYLALAETLGGDFWTADHRLADSAGTEVPWVHWIGK